MASSVQPANVAQEQFRGAIQGKYTDVVQIFANLN
jgi:hypothetical protein